MNIKSPGKISIKLELKDPRKIPREYRVRWKELIRLTGFDAPCLIFMTELLGIINDDPAPVFAASSYSDVDMFGGCSRAWSITCGDSAIHRIIIQEISESWQRVEVEKDEISISGLPGDVYINWDGNWNWGLNLLVGNIENYQEGNIAALAHSLFSNVEIEKIETDERGRLRSDLLREYESKGTCGSVDKLAPENRKALSSLLQDKDYKVAVAALNRLKRAGLFSKPDVREAILHTLKNGENITRWTAAEMLGEEGDRGYLVPLAGAFWDENETVREKAVDAVKRIGDPAGTAPLALLLEDKSPGIRKAALSAVMKLAMPEMLPVVTELAIPLLKDPDYNLREVSTYLMMNRYDEKLVEPFIECLKDKNPSVRKWAAFGLGKWREEKALPGLCELLRDSENTVILYAIEALGKIGGSEAKEALTELLELHKRLGKYGDAKIKASIAKQLKKPDEGEKTAKKKTPKKNVMKKSRGSKSEKNAFSYLQNFYYYRRILEYDRKRGPRFEIHRRLLPEGLKIEGIYIEKKGHLYGIRPSSEGLVFFADETEFHLKKGEYITVFNREEKISSFMLEKENRVLFSISYEFDILEEFDMYSGEQEDFFDWLSRELNRKHFFDFYTHPVTE